MTGLFRWGARKPDTPASSPAAETTDVLTTSKVFPRFLAALTHQPSPVLLDLGPVVGSNISFFGDRLSCKIHVEDLFADVEARAKSGESRALAQTWGDRLTLAPASVDGILCWDLFDFLDRKAGLVLAGQLTTLLRSGGALYGLFGTTAATLDHYTRFMVQTESTFRQRPYPATPAQRHVLLTRDINKMFDGLAVAESVLLKSRTRESLFRKP